MIRHLTDASAATPDLRVLHGPTNETWRRHEYATFSTGVLSMALAEIALTEPTRGNLLARNRAPIRRRYNAIDCWISEHSNVFSIEPPEATALAFVKYNLEMSSSEVADELRRRADVLVSPGDCFGVAHYLRITHGLRLAHLEEALNRVSSTLEHLVANGAGNSRPLSS